MTLPLPLPYNQLIPLTRVPLPISSPAGHSFISALVYYWSNSTCSLPDCLECFRQAFQHSLSCFCLICLFWTCLPVFRTLDTQLAPLRISLPVWLIPRFWPCLNLKSKLEFPCYFDGLIVVFLGSTLPVSVNFTSKLIYGKDVILYNQIYCIYAWR